MKLSSSIPFNTQAEAQAGKHAEFGCSSQEFSNSIHKFPSYDHPAYNLHELRNIKIIFNTPVNLPDDIEELDLNSENRSGNPNPASRPSSPTLCEHTTPPMFLSEKLLTHFKSQHLHQGCKTSLLHLFAALYLFAFGEQHNI